MRYFRIVEVFLVFNLQLEYISYALVKLDTV